MHTIIHGGDIYQNQVEVDFSVNINPLGIPDGVRKALHQAVEHCHCYPDIHAEALISGLSQQHNLSKEYIVCGNGASELLLAIMHAMKPGKILLPTPSFYGYEKAAKASWAEIFYYEMKEADGWALTEAFLEQLTADIDMIILANPNNPVGNVIDKALLTTICEKCRDLQITVVIDECFIEFTEASDFKQEHSLEAFPNVILLRAFTKIYAIPGVRLGYLLCGKQDTCSRIRAQLPEWNLSIFAQMAGVAALEEQEYVIRTREVVKTEREYLRSEMQRMGITVYNSAANFLLLRCDIPLYEMLLAEQILIRDCSNYRGLAKGYYRIAVKSHMENEHFIQKAGAIIGAD